MLKRPRRNRISPALRSLCQETVLVPQDFVAPFFVLEGKGRNETNPALPGLRKLTIDLIVKEALDLHKQGVPSVLLFPVESSKNKDEQGSKALSPEGLIPRAIQILKREIPSLHVICDIALDPYTSHGHDGILGPSGDVLNDETVAILASMSKVFAQAGADMVAPSDMMDGRVEAIRNQLDEAGFQNVGILSYSAKYASSLYGPFRDALGSGLKTGDKKGYQMDPRNVEEAIREALLDEEEGADILMVKPATYYLDVITKIKNVAHLPICAYHVSGEYAMVMAAAKQGWIDPEKALLEALLSIKRAGADFMISYGLFHILPLL